ncbi:SMP-30/gluconolactonase/LRE family protein [Microbacterium sp. XT11]|uniref:SMP-30/gluconolactonase/LRE family protein n=1 Tax=Microbacterium sp. XT11 TaxID=367477 RepID=UPI000A58A77E|nr:SMP-30/gluconolactonase/LRE family protein [Microbacterium sp. XT11]
MLTAENVTGPIAHHAEAPVWWAEERTLLWVDGEAGDLLALTPHGIRRRHVDDEYLAFVRPRAAGGLAAVGARTLHLSSEPDGRFDPVIALTHDGRVRMNDGCCDPAGRLLAGSMAYDGTSPSGTLLRVDGRLGTTTVLTAVTVSNGLGFSAGGEHAYYVDSATHRIDVFDVHDDGALVDRRPLVEIPEEQGMPDGLTVSADGRVWVALWGGSAVHAYSPDGALTERVGLPVAQVSACTFGGDDLSTLYITTSAQGLDGDHDTAAGSLFAVRPGAVGVAVTPFAG